MAGKKGNCEAGAHLISREGRPEAQMSVSKQLDGIQNGREVVQQTLEEPSYTEEEKEFTRALGFHQSLPRHTLLSE